MKGCRKCNNWQGSGEHLDRLDPATAGQKAELGLCRRYAPRPVNNAVSEAKDAGTAERLVARWPVAASDDWCGEWDPKLD